MVGVCAAWRLAVSMKDRFQRAHAIVMLLIVVAVVPAIPARADVTRAQALMGTVCEITVPDSDARFIDLAFAEAKRIDGLINTWRDDSELSQVNAQRVHDVSGELGAMLSTTIMWAQKTGGAFNPLVRPLIDAWQTRGKGAIPSKEALAEAMKRVDLANVVTTKETLEVKNGAQFDEGGWGKGIAIDRMLGVFKQKETKRVLINFGGQIGQYGDQPYVTIANPLKRDAPVVGLSLGKRSISTSSGSEKSFTVGDKTFSHIIDPRTGVAVPPRGSVSVIDNSAFVADILSTALYVMGPEAGMIWAKSHDVTAIFITDKNEILTSKPVPGLQVLDAKFVKRSD